MGKRQKDMCPFRYWRATEGNSECTGVVNVIQNAQVLSMSSKSGDKRTYVWAKAKRTCVLLAIGCVLLAIGEQEREIQNAQVNFFKKKK